MRRAGTLEVMLDDACPHRWVSLFLAFFKIAKANKINGIDLIIETDFDQNGNSNEAEIKDLLRIQNCSIVKTISQTPSLRISKITKSFTNSFLDVAIIGMAITGS